MYMERVQRGTLCTRLVIHGSAYSIFLFCIYTVQHVSFSFSFKEKRDGNLHHSRLHVAK